MFTSVIADRLVAVSCIAFFGLHDRESRLPGWAWSAISAALWIGAGSWWAGGFPNWLRQGSITAGLISQALLYAALTVWAMRSDARRNP